MVKLKILILPFLTILSVISFGKALPNPYSFGYSTMDPYCRSEYQDETAWTCWNYRNFPTDRYNASTVKILRLEVEMPFLIKLTSEHLQLYKLPNLVELQLINYKFYEVERGAFRNGGKLASLYLQWTSTVELDAQVLKDVPNLQKLQIIRGSEFLPVTDFKYYELAFLNLTEIRLRKVEIPALKPNETKSFKSLQVLELVDVKLHNLDDREVFRSLINLKTVKFNSNQISFVDPEVFADLQNLEVLNLSNNKLDEGFKNGTQFHNPNLIRLDLEYCQLKYIEEGVFENLGNLKELLLQSNRLSHIFPKLFSSLRNLETLSLYNNSITTLGPNVFSDLGNLRSMDLSKNQLESLDDRQVFSPLKNLQVLRLEWNSIRFVDPEVFADLQNLEILKLRGNKPFEGFKNGSKFHNPNLIELDLSYCQLKYIEEDLFENLEKLKKLFLHGNHLSHVSQKMFSSLKNLESLGLYNASIKTLESDFFSNLENLEFVNLRHNQLKSVNWKVFHHFQKYTTVYLDSNPWHCDCQVLYLREILEQRSIYYDDGYSSPKCTTYEARRERPIPYYIRRRGFMTWKDLKSEELNCPALPKIVELSADKQPKIGESANLQVYFSGNLPLQVIWMRDDVILRNFTLSEDKPLHNNRRPKEYIDQLKISDVDENYEGFYKVIVSNEVGYKEKTRIFYLKRDPSTLASIDNTERNFLHFVQSLFDVLRFIQ